MSGFGHTVGQTFARLEGRETPATFFVALRSLTTGQAGQTLAAHSGYLDLNAAHPSVPGGILVDAPSAVDAVRNGLFGRVGVRFNGEALFYDYGTSTTGTVYTQQKPFLVEASPPGPAYPYTHVVRLEDLAGSILSTPDWDYNDRVWYVDAIDITNPPSPPPGTVGVTVPPVNGPKLEILNANNLGMTDAKVAKWQDAYEKVSVNVGQNNMADKVLVKSDFPTGDADHFYLRVTDQYFADNPGQSPQTLQVRTDSDMMTNGLTLSKVAAGVYETRKCVLVSNTTDDVFKVNGVADNAVDDATYRVKLGDTLTISYDANPAGQISRPIIHKRVPVRVLKEVKVHVTVITRDIQDRGGNNNPSRGYATQDQVNQWLTQANETYAQVGVRLVWDTTSQFADQPLQTAFQPLDEDVILEETPVLDEGGLKRPDIPEWMPEVRGLIHGNRTGGGLGTSTPLRSAATDDVELFFVNYFRSREDAPGGGTTTYHDEKFAGYSFPASATFEDLVDSVVVSASYLDYFTVAHEIGHILANDGEHVTVEPGYFTRERMEANLMRGGSVGFLYLDEIELPPAGDPRRADWTTASKRLTEAQQTAIRTQRPSIVKDFIP